MRHEPCLRLAILLSSCAVVGACTTDRPSPRPEGEHLAAKRPARSRVAGSTHGGAKRASKHPSVAAAVASPNASAVGAEGASPIHPSPNPSGLEPPPRSAAESHPAPRETLAEACAARVAWLKTRVPRHFRIAVEGPFVVVSDLGRADFAHQLTYGVRRPAEAMWASLFARRPDRPITILLLGSLSSYRRWARELFGDEDVPYFGYYRPETRTMTMNIGSGIGTLWHELTHALLAFDFPRVPDWLNEGIGSLHEGAYTTRARMVGVTNWRLPGLQDALLEGRLRPLRELITRDDFYRGAVGIHYAHARFFIQYLQEKKQLVAFYRAFRDSEDTRDLGAAVLERVLGKRLEDVDLDFRRWVGRLRYSRRR